MENNLPEGWTECKFGDVAKIQNGFAFPSKDFRDKGVPLIKQSQLDGNKISLDNCVFLDEKYLETKKEFVLNKGDILIGMSGSIGKLCIYDLGFPALQNQRTGKIVIRNDKILNQKLFWYFLSTVEQKLKDKGKGLGITNVSATDIEDLDFILPPSTEQDQIIEKLDILFKKIQSNKTRLEKIPKILKRFRQSVLAAAVSGKLIQSKTEWKNVELISLVEKGGIFDGPFGSHLKTSDYTDKGVRVVRLENIEHLRFIEEKRTFISKEKYQTLLKHTVGGGDIIFSSFIADEIRVCKLPKFNTKAIAKADCFCVRPNEQSVNKDFLLLTLASHKSYEQLVTNIHGATRPRINTTQFKKLIVSLPPMNEQQEIVRRVEQLFSLVDKIEKRFNKVKTQIDKLPQAILSKAFKGELIRPLVEHSRTPLTERSRGKRGNGSASLTIKGVQGGVGEKKQRN